MPESDIGDLIRRLRERDRAAVVELTERYGAAIRRHIRCELRQRGLEHPGVGGDEFNSKVESLWNDAIIKFVERVRRGPLPNEAAVNVPAYIKRIVTNRLNDKWRDGRPKPPVEPDKFPGPEEPSSEFGDGTKALKKVEQILKTLSEPERTLFDLRVKGKSFPEIAAVLGGTAGRWRAMWQRLVERLRRQIQQEETHV